ncbi:MAG TPA: tetratricopeptide repeat protein [Planctomycetota bacterium]|nr:tetratricopeptide repeat protein [Planctomycetota bacterium]
MEKRFKVLTFVLPLLAAFPTMAEETSDAYPPPRITMDFQAKAELPREPFAPVSSENIENPFIKPCVYHETTLARWRHVFHHMRTTWDNYFEVYPKELANFDPCSLERMRAEPAFYLDNNVQIDVYWGKSGSIYRPFTAPFHEDGFMNYSAWAYGSDLWLKEAREQIHLLFYIDRRRKELIEKLNHVPMYTPVHLWVQERSKSEGQPWLEIKGAEIIPETAPRELTLKHLELGVKQMARKRYDLAAQAFNNALALQLPVNMEAKAYALLGRARFEARQFMEARNAFAESLIRDDSVVPNLIYLARADEEVRIYDEAKEAAEHAVTLAPGNPEARAELGLALAMSGDVKAGLRELDFAQKLAPRNQLPEANRNRAIIFVKQGKLELAKQELSQAVILRASDALLHMELGDVEMAMKQFDDAKREFGFAKDLAPTRPEPYFKYAFISKLQGDAAKKEGKIEDAKKFYSEALDNIRAGLKFDDTNEAARQLEYEMLKELGREKEAEKAADTAVEINPKNIKHLEALYEIAVKLGHWDVMERAAKLATEAKPEAKYFTRLANVLASKPGPDFENAAKSYEEAVRLDPESGSAWFELSKLRRALSNVEGAVAAAEKACEIMKSPEACLLALRAKLDRDAADPAVVDAAKAIAEAAKDDVSRAQAQSVLGAALLKNGDLDGALDALSKADPIMKENADHQFWYGMALVQKNDTENAKARLKSAVELSRSETARITQKAIEQIEKLDPDYKNRLPEPGKNPPSEAASKQPGKTPDKPIRKVLPPVIEDDGPQPISTELPRPK